MNNDPDYYTCSVQKWEVQRSSVLSSKGPGVRKEGERGQDSGGQGLKHLNTGITPLFISSFGKAKIMHIWDKMCRKNSEQIHVLFSPYL